MIKIFRLIANLFRRGCDIKASSINNESTRKEVVRLYNLTKLPFDDIKGISRSTIYRYLAGSDIKNLSKRACVIPWITEMQRMEKSMTKTINKAIIKKDDGGQEILKLNLKTTNVERERLLIKKKHRASVVLFTITEKTNKNHEKRDILY